MPKKEIILQDNSSLLGKFLYETDKISHNLQLYIKRHSVSIEIFFLLIYTGLNLFLAYLVRDTMISVFIILLLLVIAFERIIIHLKARLDKETLDRKEKQIKEEINSNYTYLDKYKYELEKGNRLLERKNDALHSKIRELAIKLKNKR